MHMVDNASARIKRIRRRFIEDIPIISIERAKYFTEKWCETGKSDLPIGVRVALSMKHVFENMNHYIDPDDRIAGKWSENFLGIPIEIERGIWNRVFKIELKKRKMSFFGLKSNLRFAFYKIRKEGLLSLYRILQNSKKTGALITTLGTDTLDKRKINPYKIDVKDRKILLKKLIPYWKNKTVADMIEKAYAESDLYTGEFGEFIAHLPLKTAQNDLVISPCAVVALWQGHLILDYEKAIKKGLLAMRDEVQKEILSNKKLSQDELDFLKSIDITLEGIMIFARRMLEKIEEELNRTTDPDRKKILSEMFENCKNVPRLPAKTFREAIQSFWIIKTTVDLSLPFDVHAPGRLDQIFYPYYINDINEERITREEARELIEELVLKVMSHNIRPYSNAVGDFSQRYEGSEPVTIGGLNRDGEDATNELSYVILEAAARSKAALNFAVRVNDNTPEDFLMDLAEIHYNGVSSFAILNDNINIQALINRGYSMEDARNYALTGCVDMCSPGKIGGIGFSAILLCRTLDMTLRNGNCMTLGGLIKDVGLKTGDPDTFESFEYFLDAFNTQSSFVMQKIVDAVEIRDRLFAEHLPSPFISAFMQDCFERKKDVTQGGAIYNFEGILFMNSIANTVDSLYVIKKLIFDQKKITFKELLDAIDNNYRDGYKHIHEMILNIDGKWGNGNPECDELARKVTTRLFEDTYKYKTYKGGKVAPFIISMTSHTYDGRISIATPDGRLAGKPFAASCNPYNVEKHGPTGVLRSVAALDFEHVCGCAVNIRMHPSGIGQTERARKKWISLLKTYYTLGGAQIQPTVVSTEVLLAAQQNPEEYRDIVVKVGGYSAYFTELGIEIQNEIISRTEHKKL